MSLFTIEPDDLGGSSFSISLSGLQRVSGSKVTRTRSALLLTILAVIIYLSLLGSFDDSFSTFNPISDKNIRSVSREIGEKHYYSSTVLHSNDTSVDSRLTLSPLQQRLYDDSLGNTTFISNKTIFGAIIMTDYGEKLHNNRTRLRLGNSTLEMDKMHAAADLSAIRSKNSRDMIAQLPFPVVHWPPVFSKACPYSASQHKSERGLLYAHYQIWLDFVYFDPYVLEKSNTNSIVGLYENDESGYLKGTFVAYQNGSLYKNHSPFVDQNIIVIFEDDADIAVTDLHEALHNELSNMTTDLLFLGWCVGRAAKPVPLCAHAYALTLEGARKAIKYMEPCGLALDEQIVIFAKNNWLTYREAFSSSYKNKFNLNYPQKGDGTHGIFHQKKMGSFNGH